MKRTYLITIKNDEVTNLYQKVVGKVDAESPEMAIDKVSRIYSIGGEKLVATPVDEYPVVVDRALAIKEFQRVPREVVNLIVENNLLEEVTPINSTIESYAKYVWVTDPLVVEGETAFEDENSRPTAFNLLNSFDNIHLYTVPEKYAKPLRASTDPIFNSKLKGCLWFKDTTGKVYLGIPFEKYLDKDTTELGLGFYDNRSAYDEHIYDLVDTILDIISKTDDVYTMMENYR